MSQPLVVHEWAPGYRLGSGVTPVYTDMTHRVHSRWRCQRGQQYQRGQAQAGSYTAGWRNSDGYLDQSNTASPYWPGIDLFTPVRVRAQYPATPNLLTGDQATAGEAMPVAPGAIPASMGIGGFYATPTIVASGSAWQGTQEYQAAVGASVASGHELLTVSSVPVRAASTGLPTTTYAWSVYVRSATTGANPTVAAAVEWVTPAGLAVSTSAGSTSVLTGSPTAGWTRVSVVASPPAGATAATLAVMLSGTVPAAGWNFQADGLQAEILALGAAAPTAWQQPGTWYPVWGGATVGIPRVYTGDGVPDRSGNYSLAQITATDVMGLLGQDKLNDAYIEALLAYSPNFIYTLSLPSTGKVPAIDWTGQRPAIPAVNFPQTGQSPQLDVSTDPTSIPQGTSGSVMTVGGTWFYDPGPSGLVSNFWSGGGIDLESSGAIGPPAASAWTRVMAFNMSSTITTLQLPTAPDNGAPYLRQCLFAFAGYGPNNYPALSLSMYVPLTWSGGVETYGTLVMWLEGYTQAGVHLNQTWTTGTYILDSAKWLLCAVSLDATGQNFTIRLQGLPADTAFASMVKYTASTGGTDFRSTGPSHYLTDTYGYQVEPWQQRGPLDGAATPGPLSQWCMNGQLGPIAELGFEINDAQFRDLATAWSTAYAGDTSGQRAARIMSWGGWSGPTNVDAGSTTMGGAGGLGSTAGPFSGQAPLSTLQATVLAEHGMAYADASGTPTFRGRSYRWSQAAFAAVFGENVPAGAAGEIPYIETSPGFDNAQTINSVQWTVGSGGPGQTSVPVSVLNATSIGASFPQAVQQGLNTADTTQAANLAQWLTNAQAAPADRVSTLRVDAAQTPGVWAQVLGLELDTLVKMNRRPLGGAALSVPAFVENIAWEMDPSRPSAVVTYQASPQVFDMPWIPALFHTTLSVQASSGAGTLTIVAPAGAASLLLSQMLPGGWQLVLDPANPAISETVTVSPTGIPTTTLGWTTAVLTLSGTLAHTHAAGAVVCEPLPAGVTDPTIYDGRSILAPAATTVAVQANSGTNTVTIAALPGAQYNPLNLLVPANWTLWLSPGTPRFEAVTVAPNGVPQTAPGWRQATLTLTANLTNTHLVGDTVCDPLPAGVTNPAALVGTVIPGF